MFQRWVERYMTFLQLVSSNWIGRIGVILSTSSFFSFIVLQILAAMQASHNIYIGVVTYGILPLLFFVGLIMIPFAWWSYRTDSGKGFWESVTAPMAQDEKLAVEFRTRVVPMLLILTAINVLFMVIAGARTLHYMDEAEFCGTTCHEVMGPEWNVYNASPHAHVACVDCHIGSGLEALAKAKLNGAWQMVSATFNLYNRPIPTPIHNLRPARHTCMKCHWPSKFYGSKLVQKRRYKTDANNTLQFTTLNLKVDAQYGVGSGIHWHIDEMNEVRFSSVDDKREEMIWVEVRRPDGSYHRFTNTKLDSLPEPDRAAEGEGSRVMDCVDCHNRATHIYEKPDAALDLELAKGNIDSNLPWVKREGMRLLMHSYDDKETGIQTIRDKMDEFYSNPDSGYSVDPAALDRSIQAMQGIYDRNIYPHMNITWNTYPNHLGHQIGKGCFSCHNFMGVEQSEGCFRCHNQKMQDEEGNSISDECTLCHSILSLGESDPLKYLTDEKFDSFEEHKAKYLRDEYLKTF